MPREIVENYVTAQKSGAASSKHPREECTNMFLANLYAHLTIIQKYLAIEFDDCIFKDCIDMVGGQNLIPNGIAASDTAVSISQVP